MHKCNGVIEAADLPQIDCNADLIAMGPKKKRLKKKKKNSVECCYCPGSLPKGTRGNGVPTPPERVGTAFPHLQRKV